MKILIFLILSFNVLADTSSETGYEPRRAQMKTCSRQKTINTCFTPYGMEERKVIYALHEDFIKRHKAKKDAFGGNFSPDSDDKAMKFQTVSNKEEIEKEIEIYDFFCKKKLGGYGQLFCLNTDEEAARRDEAEKASCELRRRNQAFKIDPSTVDSLLKMDKNLLQWKSLPDPKCKSVLAYDKQFIKDELKGRAARAKAANAAAIESCVWTNDLSRQIITVPGCGTGKSNKVCSGFVMCEKASKKSIRKANCSADHCGDSKENAQSCANETGYSSKASSKSIDGVSRQVEKALGGATQQ